MPSNQLFKGIDAIASANDQSSALNQVDVSLQGIKDQISQLNAMQGDFKAALVTNVQAQTESLGAFKSFLAQQTEVLARVVAGTPGPIPLDEADDACINQAFTFMRTLNEIESLVADSKFTEKNKDNSKKLQEYKGNALHRKCIAILRQKLEEGQLSAAEQEKFAAEFDALFAGITAALSDRAERLMAIHQFRDRILHFFAERCQNEPPAPPNPTVTTSISLVQGGATGGAPGNDTTKR